MTEQALVKRRPDPELDRLARLGEWLAYAESGQKTQTAMGATAALRMFYIQQLDLPLVAAAELSVIKGRVYVGAKLLRALGLRKGLRVIRVNSNTETCTAILIRESTGEELGRTTYTIEEATAAGLVREGSAWKTHPARMLWARASKYALDDYAPEVTLGIWTDEERAEIDGVAVELPDDYADFGPAATAETQDDIEWPAPDPFEEPSDYEPAPDKDDE